MASAQEIRVYLESYPDDHDQRWRLARKLYEQRDYATALTELLRLKPVWPDHIPLQRYLAATHYRLQQFTEAATALEIAVSRNPDDVLLLEQLAKTYEGAGRRHRAIDTWKLVLKLDASPRAVEALERLGLTEPTPSPGTPASSLQELSTHGDETLMNCPHCGEANDMFSERCWRCHGDFDTAPARPTSHEAPPRQMRSASPLRWIAVAALAVVLAAALGYYRFF
jgi:tetratricopeptide (TPR) repeat protein